MKHMIYTYFRQFLKWFVIACIIFFICNSLTNYGFWFFQLYAPGLSGETWDILPTFFSYLYDPNTIFSKWGGQIVVVSKVFMFLDYAFFRGSNFIPLIRQMIFVIVEMWILHSILSKSSLNIFLRFVCLGLAFVIFINPIVWYSINSIHEGWIDIYFFIFLSLYFFTQSLSVKSVKKQYLYTVWSVLFAMIASITFGAGIVIFPVLIVLSWLSRQYKKFALYGIFFIFMAWFFQYLGGENLGNRSLLGAITHWTFWKTLIFSFAAPSGYGKYPQSFYWILSFPRALIVMGLIGGILYTLIIKPFWLMKQRPYFQWAAKGLVMNYFKADPWKIFFVGLLFFSLVNMILISLTRYYYVEMNSGYLLSMRFQFNALMMIISVVFLATSFIKKHILLAFVYMGYMGWIIFAGHYYIGTYYNDNIRNRQQNILLAMDAYTPKYSQQLDYYPHNNYYVFTTWERLWNIGGFGIWQKNYMGMNIDHYIKQGVFREFLPCPGQLQIDKNSLTIGQEHESYGQITEAGKSSIGNQIILHQSMIPFRTVELHGKWVHSGHTATLFVTNAKNIIVGLGFPLYANHNVHFATLWNIGSLLAEDHWDLRAMIKLPLHGSGTYTVWALGRNRQDICKIATIQAP